MKKNVIKMAVAAVCVVAAGMGGLKAYNVADLSKAEMVLAQNVDALSADFEYELEEGQDISEAVVEIVSNHCNYPKDGANCHLIINVVSNGQKTMIHESYSPGYSDRP